MIYILTEFSKTHTWLLPVFAVGLGAPRWCQMLWGTSSLALYIPWGGAAGPYLGTSLWLWLGVLDAIQGVGLGMILLQVCPVALFFYYTTPKRDFFRPFHACTFAPRLRLLKSLDVSASWLRELQPRIASALALSSQTPQHGTSRRDSKAAQWHPLPSGLHSYVRSSLLSATSGSTGRSSSVSASIEHPVQL